MHYNRNPLNLLLLLSKQLRQSFTFYTKLQRHILIRVVRTTAIDTVLLDNRLDNLAIDELPKLKSNVDRIHVKEKVRLVALTYAANAVDRGAIFFFEKAIGLDSFVAFFTALILS
jgi:hypothetical protein